jgi:hypothetical protein
MNLNIATVACVAIAASLPLLVVAQTAPPAAVAVAADVAQAEPVKKASTRKESRAIQEKADARLCLEFPTELMIIKCAEKYRLNKREP